MTSSPARTLTTSEDDPGLDGPDFVVLLTVAGEAVNTMKDTEEVRAIGRGARRTLRTAAKWLGVITVTFGLPTLVACGAIQTPAVTRPTGSNLPQTPAVTITKGKSMDSTEATPSCPNESQNGHGQNGQDGHGQNGQDGHGQNGQDGQNGTGKGGNGGNGGNAVGGNGGSATGGAGGIVIGCGNASSGPGEMPSGDANGGNATGGNGGNATGGNGGNGG